MVDNERFKQITETVVREPQFIRGITIPVPFLSEELLKLWESLGGRRQYTLPHFRSSETQLFYQAMHDLQNGKTEQLANIAAVLNKRRLKDFEELTSKERWDDSAVQMPGDWGPSYEHRETLSNLVTQKAKGKVLEAMCGFNSYFQDDTAIEEVVALDFSEEALKRYSYPNRTRIAYDLERVVQGESLEFADEEFQTVGIFFGINYLSDPIPVYKELHRVLSPDGNILLVGNPGSGYKDLEASPFEPERVSLQLASVGFEVSVMELGMHRENQLGRYYLVEGVK
jgi:SAM-dependent methyltransferase